MAMSFEFVSGTVPRPPKRMAQWPELQEEKENSFCGKPYFYINFTETEKKL